MVSLKAQLQFALFRRWWDWPCVMLMLAGEAYGLDNRGWKPLPQEGHPQFALM